MQLLMKPQDSWLRMGSAMSANSLCLKRSRRDPCCPGSKNCGSKIEVEVCGIAVGPKSGDFLFDPGNLISQFFSQLNGPQDDEQGEDAEPEQKAAQVDGGEVL